jgi:hypothetical protein
MMRLSAEKELVWYEKSDQTLIPGRLIHKLFVLKILNLRTRYHVRGEKKAQAHELTRFEVLNVF